MRIFTRLLLAPVFTLLPAFGLHAAELRSATVTQTFNDVKLIEPNKSDEPAASGARIAGQRGVRTGEQSRAELEFQDRTLTRLGANTIFSFEGGTRSMEMQQGTMLLQVPKNAGGAKIRTAAVTAAITGTTILLEYTPDRVVTEGGKKKKKKGFIKVIVLEGTLKLSLNNGSNQTVTLNAGQMLITDPNTVQLPGSVTVDLATIAQTSLLVNNSYWGSAGVTGRGGSPQAQGRLSMALINPEIERQREAIVAGTLVDVNLSNSFYGSDVQTLQFDLLAQLNTRFSVETHAEPTATPTPDKFGALPTVPPGTYPVDNTSIFVLDPIVTGPGGTVEGRIYRGTQDGTPTNYLFGQTASAFDTSVGFTSAAYFNVGSGFPTAGVTVFRFTGLNVTGSPVFQTQGIYTNLTIATLADASIGGTAAFTLNLSPLTSFNLITQNGGINLLPTAAITASPGTLLGFLARGANGNIVSNATISLANAVFMAAEGTIALTGSVSTAARIHLVAQGNVSVNATLAAPDLAFTSQTGTLTLAPGGINTAQLTSLVATGRTIVLTAGFNAGTSASTIAFNAGAGGFNAVGFTLAGTNRQISVNVTGGGGFSAQSFFGNSLVLTGGGALNVPGTLDVTTLNTTGAVTVGTLNSGGPLSLASITASVISIANAGANFTASGDVIADALSVPGAITIGGSLRPAGVVSQRDVSAGGNISITGSAGLLGQPYFNFISTGGSITVGAAVNGLSLFATRINAAGNLTAGGILAGSMTVGGNITAGTNFNGFSLIADGSDNVNSYGGITAGGSVTAGGIRSAFVSAGAGGITTTLFDLQAGGIGTAGPVSVARDLVFSAPTPPPGPIQLPPGTPIFYEITSGALTVGRDVILNIETGRPLRMDMSGALSIAGNLVVTPLTATAGGNVTINSATFSIGGFISLRVADGGFGGGGAVFNLTTTGAATLHDIFAQGGNAGGGSGLPGGAGGRVTIVSGDTLSVGSIDIRPGLPSAIPPSIPPVRPAPFIDLRTTAGDIVVNGQFFSDIQVGTITLNAARDILTNGAQSGQFGLASFITAGRDLIVGQGDFFAEELTVGRNVTAPFSVVVGTATVGGNLAAGGSLFFADASVSGNLTAAGLGPNFVSELTSGALAVVSPFDLPGKYTLRLGGSLTVGGLAYGPSSTTPDTVSTPYELTIVSTAAGGTLTFNGPADFRGGTIASTGQTGPGGSLFINVPAGGGTPVTVDFGSGFSFNAAGGNSTVDSAIVGGQGGRFRLFATGNLSLGSGVFGSTVIDVRGGSAATLAGGRVGNGGAVEIVTTGSVNLQGAINAGTGLNGPGFGSTSGNGGSITIDGSRLTLTDPATLTVSTDTEPPAPSPAPPAQAGSSNGGSVTLIGRDAFLGIDFAGRINAGISDFAAANGGTAGTVTLSAPNGGGINLTNGYIHNNHGILNVSAPGGTIALRITTLIAGTINFNALTITQTAEATFPQGTEVNYVAGSGGIVSQSALGFDDDAFATTLTSVGSITATRINARFILATGANADIRTAGNMLAFDGNISATRDIIATSGGSIFTFNGNVTAGRDIISSGGIFTAGDPFTITAGRDIISGPITTGSIVVGRNLTVSGDAFGNGLIVNRVAVPGTLSFDQIPFIIPNNAAAGTPDPLIINAGSIVSSIPIFITADGESPNALFPNPGNGGSVSITTGSPLVISFTGLPDAQFGGISATGGTLGTVGPTSGGNGGSITLNTGGAFTLDVGSYLRALSSNITTGSAQPNFLGAGGSVQVNAAGPMQIDGRIEVSGDENPLGGFSTRFTSASGGTIGLTTTRTTGTGITVGATAELFADVRAGRPGGTIALTTSGADIDLTGATMTARNGSITLTAPGATVSMAGAFLQAGTLNLNLGASGVLSGYGSIQANLANSSILRPGLGATSTGLNFTGNLTLLGSSQLQFQLGGLTQATQYGFISVNGATTLGGQLVLSFVNGFESSVTNGNSFTLLASSTPFVGAFSNIASGGRLTVGLGSFLVTYTGGNLIASDFQISSTLNAIWDGSNNAWSSGANWSTAPLFPNGNFSATINGGTVNLDGAYSVRTLNLNGGILGGTGSLAAMTVNFTGTTGVGLDFNAGTITASEGVVLRSLAGTGNFGGLSGSALVVNAGPNGGFSGVDNGTVFNGNDGAILRNAPGATFTVALDHSDGFHRVGSGLPVFDNQGTFVRSTGSGLFGIFWVFNNSGTVNLQTGVLGFGNGGTSTGVYNVSLGTQLHFAAGTHNLNGGSVNGPGEVRFTGDFLNLGGAVGGSANWLLQGGDISGVTGSLAANTFNFQRSGGSITTVNSGTLTASNGVIFQATGTNAALGSLAGNAVVVSQGVGGFLGAGTDFVVGRDNAVFRNAAGGIFTTTVDNPTAFLFLSGNPSIDNQGTFAVDAGAGSFGSQWAFNNSGTVQVMSGKFLLDRGGSSTGTFNIAAGSLLGFTNGTYNLNAGTSFGGAGGVALTGGVLNLGGAVGGSASVLFSGGDVTGVTGSWNLATLNFQRSLGAATTVSSGTLTATNGVNFIASSATNALGTITGNAVVINAGNGTFTGTPAGDFVVGNGNGVFRNAAGAAFDAQIDHNQGFFFLGGAPVFDNQGSFIRSVGTGNFVIDWTFNNSGSVNVQSGKLILSRGGSATGTFNTLAGAFLTFGGGTYSLANGVSLSGGGGYFLTAGTLNLGGVVNGGANFTFAGGDVSGPGSLALGSLNFQRGLGTQAIFNSGTFVAANGVFLQSGASGAALGTLAGNALVLNQGNGTFTGAGADFFVGSNNAIFRNAVGATFDVRIDNAQAFFNNGGTPLFDNQGTFSRTTGTGTLGIQWGFTNSGTVLLQSGTTVFSGSYTQTAGSTFLLGGNLSSTTVLNINGGTLAGNGLITGFINMRGVLRADVIGTTGLNIAGTLSLLNGGQTQFTLAGLVQGAQYSFIGVNGSVGLGGQLVVSFANGFQGSVTGTDTFTIMTGTAPFSGAFSNVASGSRLPTSDGFGSFLVTYAGNNLVLSSFVPAGSTNAIWSGATGNWSSTTQWSTAPAFPNGAFDATINAGTVALDGNYAVQNFTLTGGTLNGGGANTLTANQLFTWSGGTLGTGGTYIANGGLLVNGAANRQLNAATLNLVAGQTATDAGNHTLTLTNLSRINNSGTWLAQNDSGISSDASANQFGNTGTFTRDTGTGTYAVAAVFNNSGTVNVNSGLLQLDNTSTHTGAAAVNVSAGSALTFGGVTHTFASGTSLTSAGTVNFAASTTFDAGSSLSNTGPTTLTLGASLTLNNNATLGALTVGSGGITGAGNLTIAGLFNWNGGELANAGTTTANGGMNWGVGTPGRSLRRVTLNSSGPVSWTSGSVSMSAGAIFNNNGTFDTNFDGQVQFLAGAPTFINNAGTFTKSGGTGTTSIGVDFNNTGVVNANSGTLAFVFPVTSTGGTFNVATGATLGFDSTLTADAASSFGGAGTFRFTGPILRTINGAYNSTGTTSLSGGELVFNGPASFGTLNLSGDPNTVFLTANAAGNSISTAFNWSGGQLRGAGTTTIQPGAVGSITQAGSNIFLAGHTLINNSTSNFVIANQTVFMSGGAAFVNNGQIELQGPSSFRPGAGGGTIQNTGTFTKTLAGNSTVEAAFNNSGVVNANSGDLNFLLGYTQAAGTLNLNGGTVSGSTLNIQGGLLTGSGSISAVLMNNGMLRPSIGTGSTGLAVSGNLSLLSGSQMQFTLAGLVQGAQYGFIGVNGNVALGGQLVLSFANGFQASVTGGDTFTIMTGTAPFSGAFSNVASGARLTTSDGFGSFVVTYAGSNVVLSAWVPAGSTNAIWDGSTGNWSSTTQWSIAPSFPNGAFDATINAGAVTLDGNYAVQNFTLTGGSLTGPNILTVNNLFTWGGGTLGGGGTFIANGGLLVNGSGIRQLDAAALNIPTGQIATDLGGHLFFISNSGQINNAGTWNATGAAGGISFTIGGTNVFNNSGTFNRNGTGDYTFGSVQFNNSGTVNLTGGNFQLNGGGSSTGGTFNVGAGTIFRVNTVYTFDAASTIAGAGAVNFTNFSPINVDGTYNIGGLTTVAGSTVNFAQSSSSGGLTFFGGTVNIAVGQTLNLSAPLTFGGTSTLGGGGIVNLNAGGAFTSNSALALTGGTTLNVPAGQTVTDSGNHTFTLSTTSRINNGGTWLAQNNTGISISGAGNTFSNTGTFTRDTGGSSYNIAAAFTNSGTVNASSGALVFSGGFQQVGTGTTNLNGGNLTGTTTLDFQSGLLTGSGSIFAGTLAMNAVMRPALAGTGFAVNGTLSLLSGAQLQFQLGGLTQGSQYGFISVNGNVGLGGQLVLSFANGFQTSVTGTDTFTLLTTNGALGGAFANVASGARLPTADGFGSFLVTYSGSSLVLSAFSSGSGPALWDGTIGNWSSTTQWSIAPSFPNGTVDAIINGGSVTLDNDYAVQNFNLGGGTLAGGNMLTVGGLFTWTGGTLMDAILRANGGLALSGAAARALDGASLTVPAGQVANDSGGHTFTMSNSASIGNAGTWNAGGTGGLTGAGPESFSNTGTFNRNGAGNYTLSLVQFNNTGGTVNVQAGELTLGGGGFHTGGTFNVSAGATLRFTGGNHTLDAASSISGAGSLIFGNSSVINLGFVLGFTGPVTQDTSNVFFNNNAFTGGYSFGAGSLRVIASRSLTVNGLFTWTGGTIGGGGTSPLGTVLGNGGFLTNGTTQLVLSRLTVVNASGQIWTDSGNKALSFGDNGILDNSGTFLAQNDTGITSLGGTGQAFNNNGTFTRNVGTGTYGIAIPFNNSGTLNLSTGMLQLSGGGTQTGAVNVAAASTLVFSGGTHDFNSGAGLASPGAVVVNNGTVNFNAGSSFSAPGALAVSAGAFNLNTGGTAGLFTLGGGTFGGTGNLTLSGLFTWSGGSISGSGTIFANGGLDLSGGARDIAGRTLNFGGTSTWSVGNISTSAGAILSQSAGGSLSTGFDGRILYTGGAATAFNNAGTFTKSGGTGTTSVELAFNNSGTVNASSGTLAFTSTYTQTAGALNLNGGNVSTTSSLNLQGGLLTGSGTITGAIQNAAEIRPLIGPGSTGLAVTGNVTLLGSSLISLQIGGLTQGSQYSSFPVTGTLALGGQLAIAFANGFQSTVSGTDTFTVIGSSAPLSGAFSNIASGGRLNTTDGFGSFLVTYSGNAVVLSAFGAAMVPEAIWNGGNNVWSSAANWSTNPIFPNGTGSDARINNGTVDLDGDFQVRNLVMAGGNLLTTSSRNLTVNQLFTWSGGRLAGLGILANGGALLNGNTGLQLDGAAITVPSGQSFTDTGAHDITFFNGARIVNNGTFFARNDGGIIDAGGRPQPFSLNGAADVENAGMLVREVGTGVYSIGMPFHNAGSATVLVNSGTLDFNSIINDGLITVNNSATLRISGLSTFNGPLRLNAGGLTIAAGNNLISFASVTGVTGVVTVQGTSTLELNSGFAFAGADGAVPGNGGSLTFTAPNANFGISTGQIGGADLRGGDAALGSNVAGGNGGTFFATGVNNLTVGTSTVIDAVNGLHDGVAFGASGGSITLATTNGVITLNGTVQASNSVDGSGATSRNGGTILIQAGALSGTGITLASSGTIRAGISNTALGAGGTGGSVTLQTAGTATIDLQGTIDAPNAMVNMRPGGNLTLATGTINAPGGILSITTTGAVDFQGATINASGLLVDAGSIFLNPSATFPNILGQGTLLARTGNITGGLNGGAATLLDYITQAGAITLSTGLGNANNINSFGNVSIGGTLTAAGNVVSSTGSISAGNIFALSLNGATGVSGFDITANAVNSNGAVTFTGVVRVPSVTTTGALDLTNARVNPASFTAGTPNPVALNFNTLASSGLIYNLFGTATGNPNVAGSGGTLTLTQASSALLSVGGFALYGADTSATPTGGSNGGSLTIGTAGALTIGGNIDAYTGSIPAAGPAFFGTGGVVNLTAGGTLTVNGLILTTGTQPAGAPHVQSQHGGTVTLSSAATTGTAIQLNNNIAAGLTSGAIAAGGTAGNLTVRSAGGTIALNPVILDVSGGRIDFGFTGGSGAISFAAFGGGSFFARDLVFSAESLSLNNVTLNISNRADFNIGTGGITGNANLAVAGGGLLFIAPVPGPINLTGGNSIDVAGPLQATAITSVSITAPSITTTSGDLNVTGNLRANSLSVAGNFPLTSGNSQFAPFSPATAGTPAAVTISTGTYNATNLNYNLNGTATADPNVGGNGGTLNISSTGAMNFGSTISNVNASGAPTSLAPTGGSNGGTVTLTAGGNFTLSGPIVATTGLIPAGGTDFFGTGGTVSITAGGSILFTGFNPGITVSNSEGAGPAHTASFNGGIITLTANAASGMAMDVRGISAAIPTESSGPGSSLLLRAPNGGSITLREANVSNGLIDIQAAGAVSLPTGNSLFANAFNITAQSLTLGGFTPVVDGLATWNIGAGGVSGGGVQGISIQGGGQLNLTSVGSVTDTGGAGINVYSLFVTGATGGISTTGPITAGLLLRSGGGGITGSRINLDFGASLLTTGAITLGTTGQLFGPGATVSGTTYTGGSITADAVTFTGSVLIDTGFAQQYGISANTVSIGGTLTVLNAQFLGLTEFDSFGTPTPYALNSIRLVTGGSFVPTVLADGRSYLVSNGNGGDGGSVSITLSDPAGLSVGSSGQVFNIYARGGEGPNLPTAGGNGGSITLTLAGPLVLAAGAEISATSGLLRYETLPDAWGHGGTITATASTLNINGSIVASNNEAIGVTYYASVNGGHITLNATNTSGTTITLGQTASLLADRYFPVPGEAGSITITGNGGDISIDTRGRINVEDGSLVIQTYRPGNPVSGTLDFTNTGATVIQAASFITLRANRINYNPTFNNLPLFAGYTISTGSGGFTSNAPFVSNGFRPFNFSSTGDVSVLGGLGVTSFDSSSMLTLGLGNLSVAGPLSFATMTSSGGTISAASISAMSITGAVVETNGGSLATDTLTATLAGVRDGAFTYQTASGSHVWNVGTLRGSNKQADLDFRGLDGSDTVPAANGVNLTLNLGSALLVDNPAGTQGLGTITFDGGNAFGTGAAGDGGTLTATVDAFTVSAGRVVTATTGVIQAGGPATSGRGGTIDVTAANDINIHGRVEVSSDEASAAPRRRSNQGGTVRLTSNRSSATAPITAIRVGSTGQLNALLNAAATGPGGRVTIVATGQNGRIQMDGRARADRGTVEIRSNGASGSVVTSASTDVRGDIVKIGALGNNGILTIGGGTFSADTTLQLYATGSNGLVQFTGNTTLQGNSLKYIAGQTVTVNNGVQVNIQGTSPVRIFTNTPNYTGSGGNGTTTGTFTGQGGTTQPFGGQPGF